MKYLTFSRTFPAYHPKKGQPTYFVEAIWEALQPPDRKNEELNEFVAQYCDMFDAVPLLVDPKHHTIRGGTRFKKGDQFVPKVWTGKPYCSKQFQFAPPITVTNTWRVKVQNEGNSFFVTIDSESDHSAILSLAEVAKNDGLLVQEFQDWFNPNPRKSRSFEGQIICWSDITYHNKTVIRGTTNEPAGCAEISKQNSRTSFSLLPQNTYSW